MVGRGDDGSTRYRTIRIDGVDIFYREAGPADAPAILTELRNELGALREAFGLPIEADA